MKEVINVDFNNFIEQYKSMLTDSISLSDLINESKSNYRVKKLLILYMFKDKETYNHMTTLSYTDDYAKKLLDEARITLIKLLKGHKFNNIQMKQLIKTIIIETNCFNKPDIRYKKIDNLDFIKYAKMFNDYLCHERFNKLDDKTKQRIEDKLEKIDLDNLIRV